jgi:hypothetical protein
VASEGRPRETKVISAGHHSGAGGTAHNVDDPCDRLPLGESDKSTVPKPLDFANHASIGAFTADADLQGAVFSMHLVGQGLDAGKSGGSTDYRTLYIGMERAQRSRAAGQKTDFHEANLTARAPSPVEGARQADVSIGCLFNQSGEPRALEFSLDRDASASEDSDMIDNMLCPDDRDMHC